MVYYLELGSLEKTTMICLGMTKPLFVFPLTQPMIADSLLFLFSVLLARLLRFITFVVYLWWTVFYFNSV